MADDYNTSGFRLFGFEIKRAKDNTDSKKLQSIVPKVDDDGAGEQLTSDPASRISQNPNDPSAMITRTDEDANAVNEGKTLESMRNTLNTYLSTTNNNYDACHKPGS